MRTGWRQCGPPFLRPLKKSFQRHPTPSFQDLSTSHALPLPPVVDWVPCPPARMLAQVGWGIAAAARAGPPRSPTVMPCGTTRWLCLLIDSFGLQYKGSSYPSSPHVHHHAARSPYPRFTSITTLTIAIHITSTSPSAQRSSHSFTFARLSAVSSSSQPPIHPPNLLRSLTTDDPQSLVLTNIHEPFRPDT